MPLGVVAFVAGLTDKIEQTQEEHGVPRTNIIKYRLWRVCRALHFALFSYERHRLHSGTSDNSKERPFIVEILVAFPYYLNDINTESLRNAVRRSSLCGGSYWQNWTNTRRARRAPNKHYEIPFERGYAVPLPFIIFSYKRHRLHSGTSDDLATISFSIHDKWSC